MHVLATIAPCTPVGSAVTIAVVAVVGVLLVIIAGLLVVVAAKTKILCWAEKFATFQGTSFNNPTYERNIGSAGESSALDGELYVARKAHSFVPALCT